MEARGSPNVDQNRNISWIFRDPLPESPPGGFGEGSGWIWGGFWEGFGGIWEARRSPNGHQNEGISRTFRYHLPGAPRVPPSPPTLGSPN